MRRETKPTSDWCSGVDKERWNHAKPINYFLWVYSQGVQPGNAVDLHRVWGDTYLILKFVGPKTVKKATFVVEMTDQKKKIRRCNSKSAIDLMAFPKRPWFYYRDLQSTILEDYYFLWSLTKIRGVNLTWWFHHCSSGGEKWCCLCWCLFTDSTIVNHC